MGSWQAAKSPPRKLQGVRPLTSKGPGGQASRQASRQAGRQAVKTGRQSSKQHTQQSVRAACRCMHGPGSPRLGRTCARAAPQQRSSPLAGSGPADPEPPPAWELQRQPAEHQLSGSYAKLGGIFFFFFALARKRRDAGGQRRGAGRRGGGAARRGVTVTHRQWGWCEMHLVV